MKKDWRERELTMEVIVGLFMLLIFLGLGYFTIILSKEALFREKSEMQVTFSDVMGLRVGDNVTVCGMPVGKVKLLELVDSPEEGAVVCATLAMDKPLRMREGYSIKIVSMSLLGGRQMQIDEGPATGDTVALERYHGATPYDLMDDAAEIVSAARTQIVDGRVFEKLRNVVDQIDQVVTRVNAGQGLLGKVLSDDESLYKDLRASATALRTFMERLEAGKGSAGKFFADDAVLYDDLAATISTARSIAEQIQRGEGTLGKFISDPTIYNEIEETVGEVRAAVDDFRETAPITTFTSIFFGAF